MGKLQGYKTYIVAAIAGVVVTLRVLDVIDDEMMKYALALLGVGGIVTVKAAQNRIEKKL